MLQHVRHVAACYMGLAGGLQAAVGVAAQPAWQPVVALLHLLFGTVAADVTLLKGLFSEGHVTGCDKQALGHVAACTHPTNLLLVTVLIYTHCMHNSA